MTTRPFTVALDGPAASGKGTIARALARQFGFAYLDTGLLYRAVGAQVNAGRDAVEAAESLTAGVLDDPGLRSSQAGQAASKVAAMPAVRAALKDFQRAFARRAGGAVLDGRDIGTVICPQAEVKLYVTASAEARARRRHRELAERGDGISYAEVLADIEARDERDMNRSDAPLRAAEGAVTLDTTEMSIEDAVAAATRAVEARLPQA
ncbi:(d)CMP kinase [Marinibacterium sp. SX1]|uniref:(d)CMP kinase n=1 Tax=Marinibacterium sp. SX1 TaxID=3388424 RepID=UPI003D176014